MLQWREKQRTRKANAAIAGAGVEVPVSSLVDLAVDAWRLDRWLAELDGRQATAAGRYVSRRIATFLGDLEIETIDLTGHRYEPGLALELIGNVTDETLPPDTVLVDEMVSPLCLWRGKVVRLGQVVTRSSAVPTSIGEET